MKTLQYNVFINNKEDFKEAVLNYTTLTETSIYEKFIDIILIPLKGMNSSSNQIEKSKMSMAQTYQRFYTLYQNEMNTNLIKLEDILKNTASLSDKGFLVGAIDKAINDIDFNDPSNKETIEQFLENVRVQNKDDTLTLAPYIKAINDFYNQAVDPFNKFVRNFLSNCNYSYPTIECEEEYLENSIATLTSEITDDSISPSQNLNNSLGKIRSDIGDLDKLETENKDSLVVAINEVKNSETNIAIDENTLGFTDTSPKKLQTIGVQDTKNNITLHGENILSNDRNTIDFTSVNSTDASKTSQLSINADSVNESLQFNVKNGTKQANLQGSINDIAIKYTDETNNPKNPSQPNEIANKNYVDGKVATLANSIVKSIQITATHQVPDAVYPPNVEGPIDFGESAKYESEDYKNYIKYSDNAPPLTSAFEILQDLQFSISIQGVGATAIGNEEIVINDYVNLVVINSQTYTSAFIGNNNFTHNFTYDLKKDDVVNFSITPNGGFSLLNTYAIIKGATVGSTQPSFTVSSPLKFENNNIDLEFNETLTLDSNNKLGTIPIVIDKPTFQTLEKKTPTDGSTEVILPLDLENLIDTTREFSLQVEITDTNRNYYYPLGDFINMDWLSTTVSFSFIFNLTNGLVGITLDGPRKDASIALYGPTFKATQEVSITTVAYKKGVK